MIKLNKLLLGAAIAFTAFSFTTDANAEDQTGNATATIEQQIQITEDTALAFATIAADPAGDTITLAAATSAVTSPGSSTFSGTAAAGSFDLTGTPSAALNVSFSTGDTLTGPGTAMALDNFVSSVGTTPSFNGAGALTLDVGADLTVGANQVGGSYAGTYTLTVDYQ